MCVLKEQNMYSKLCVSCVYLYKQYIYRKYYTYMRQNSQVSYFKLNIYSET